MNNEIKKGMESVKKLSLSTDEKQKMLHNLKLHIDFNKPILNSYFLFKFFNTKLSFALASILVVIMAGGTAAYASEKSLPGDLLYPLKTNIVEPIKVALAVTSENKAKVESGIAEERLKEAETLSKENKLSTSTADKLNNDFIKHTENFIKLNDKINNTKDSDFVPRAERDFESKINAHSPILNMINHGLKDGDELPQKNSATKTSLKIKSPYIIKSPTSSNLYLKLTQPDEKKSINTKEN